MAAFDDLIEAQLSGATVRCAPLVVFEFASETVRLWSGFGDLVIGVDSPVEIFKGIGNLGQISSIDQGTDGIVEEMTFSVFGDEGLLANIAADAEESDGRVAKVLLQFFDVRKFDESGNYVDWKALDEPLVLFQGVMGPLKVSRRPPSENQRATRTVSVTAEGYFVRRASPSWRYWSDRDQKGLLEDVEVEDEMFSRVSLYADHSVAWPKFS